MSLRIAINGFGRIGRAVARALVESGYQQKIQLVAINELAEISAITHLLQYDSTHGRFQGRVMSQANTLWIQDIPVQVSHSSKIEDLPWRELGIDIVLDCTGIYGNRAEGEAHLTAGAGKVLFSHPGETCLDRTVVYGVNHQSLTAADKLVSNASCTTNCIIPIISLLHNAFGIISGTVTTIHAAMQDQNVVDSWHSDLRRSRAASQSIIPVDTKLAAGITRFFPEFDQRFEAIAVRVPVLNVTAIDLSVTVEKQVDNQQVNQLFSVAAQSDFRGIVNYTELPLVSVDFNHDPHSAIVDGNQTRVSGGHLIKTLSWCDNEWGFAHRMLDTALAMAKA